MPTHAEVVASIEDLLPDTGKEIHTEDIRDSTSLILDYVDQEVAAIDSGGAVDSVNGETGVVTLTKSDVGLANVDNVSDANKPVSTAMQAALDAKGANTIAFVTAIPFNKDYSYYLKSVTADITLTPNSTGRILGGGFYGIFIGDGSHNVELDPLFVVASGEYVADDTNVNVLNVIWNGLMYHTTWTDLGLIPNDAPVASSVNITGTQTNGSLLTGHYTYTDTEGDIEGASTFVWQRSANGTSGWANIGGATASTYTLQAADMLNYVRFGVTPVAATGTVTGTQQFSAATSQIPDTVAPVLQTATVENSNPNKIVLTYNETLDSGSVPATTDFAPSGGKTVTNVSLSGATCTLTVNTNYANGDTITIGYTAGTNKLRDAAHNNCANLSAQAVTNNISPSGPVFLTIGTSSSVTESPAHTFTFGVAGAMLMAEVLNGDGYFEFQFLTPKSGSQDVFMVCDHHNANDDFTAPWDCMVTDNSLGYYWNEGAYSPVSSGVASADGDLIRFTRAGSTITAAKSSDGGSTWTTIKVFTGTYSAPMYAKADGGTGKGIKNLKGLGVV